MSAPACATTVSATTVSPASAVESPATMKSAHVDWSGRAGRLH